VLNGRGARLWDQCKIHPYAMQPYEQRLYGLDTVFGGEIAKEHIETTPRQIAFRDSRYSGIRMTVAICEDSAQHDPMLNAIRAYCPNLVFVPVMAGALLKTRGFVRTAEDLAREPGCLTMVVNSAALPSAEWRITESPGRPPLGVVSLPGLLIASDKSYVSYVLLDEPEIVDTLGTQALLFEFPSGGAMP
jgi:hypothetical protein